ncbi:MAG TPA: phosphate signaling complex protein PhoU [Xanthomonadaceae bacterium]|nr:phosphate signaling complex protein PhoU [Xanthomonadaceae bacterium]
MSSQHEHINTSYDEELKRLAGEIVRMGELAIEQLRAAMAAMLARDSAAARAVIAADEHIDALELEASHDVIRLLALRQPMAGDLRGILAALRIAAAIERVGDYAANVAKRSIVLNEAPALPHTGGLQALAETAVQMLRDVLAAYLERDARRAMAVRDRDADLDALHTGLFRELVTYMMEDPRHITSCAHLLFMAKNLERIGDHATNIAENVWFLVEGDLPADKRQKRDMGSGEVTR